MKIFKGVLKDINFTYLKNKRGKQDSWKTCPVDFLEEKFNEELKEFNEAKGMRNTYPELLDVILVGLMLAERIRTKLK